MRDRRRDSEKADSSAIARASHDTAMTVLSLRKSASTATEAAPSSPKRSLICSATMTPSERSTADTTTMMRGSRATNAWAAMANDRSSSSRSKKRRTTAAG